MEQAIRLRLYRITFPGKNYSLESILNDTAAGDTYVTEDTRGFYRHFYKYLFDE